MKKIFKKFAWYPPAESKLPTAAFFSAIRSKAPNFEKTLSAYLGVQHCTLANSAQTLLYLLLDALHKHDPNKRNEVLISGYTCYSVAACGTKKPVETTYFIVYLCARKSSNLSINPGRGGLFLEDRITHDGNGYVRRTGISSNVTADKGTFERKKRFVGH